MSTQAEALAWAWRQEVPGRPVAKFVLVAIAGETARIKGGPYVAEPGNAQLMRLTGLSESAVRRNVSVLIEAGLIARTRTNDGKGHRSKDKFELPVSVAASVPTGRKAYRAQSPLGSTPTGTTDGAQTGASTGESDTAYGLVGSEPGGPSEQTSTKNTTTDSPTATGSVGTNSTSVGAATRSAKRGTRLPEGWRPNEKTRAWTLARIPEREAGKQLQLFQNYWLAKAGRDATKLDWERTWQTWVINYMDRRGNGGGSAGPRDFVEERQQRMANDNLWQSTGSNLSAEDVQRLRARQAELASQARGSA